MRVVCVKTYFDTVLGRTIGVGEDYEISEERFKELSTKDNAENAVLVKKYGEKK